MERFSGSLSDYENHSQEACKYMHEISRLWYSEHHLFKLCQHTPILNKTTCTVNKTGEQCLNWSAKFDIFSMKKTTFDLVTSLIHKMQNPVIRGKKES